MYGIGKGLTLKNFVTDTHFREHVKVFDSLPASKEEIVKAGEQVIVCLYSWKPEEGLDGLRFRRCAKRCPLVLPRFSHKASIRVYHQFMQWKGKEKQVTAEEWGWRLNDDGQLVPEAPEALLRVVRCNCLSDCSNMRCTGKEHDFECSAACGHCRGTSCTYAAALDFDEDLDEDEND